MADFFGVPESDPRHPDVFGRAQVGVVYTGGTKIAEHGGDNPADRDVPLVAYAPGAVPMFSNCATAVMACAGAKGFVIKTLFGTPNAAQSWESCPVI